MNCAGVCLSLALWVTLSLTQQAAATLDPNGTHVCSKNQSYVQAYRVTHQISSTKKVTHKCSDGWSGYKTCYKNQVVYQAAYKLQYKEAYRTAYICCVGWKQEKTSCPRPICSQGCSNGSCSSPDVCSCFAGYHGASCSQICLPNKWGPGCNNTCQCQNNATCNSRNGSCSCLPGWQGDTCASPCNPGYYGDRCEHACQCPSKATCDHVTGNCTCLSGWLGPYCNISCNPGYYGDQCQNNATCSHVTGKCICEIGYHGKLCEKPCHPGYYGNNCTKRCAECLHGSCDHVNGTCLCRDGFMGTRCNESCPYNRFGKNCSQLCSCSGNSTCSSVDGTCVCAKGFTGKLCDKMCPYGFYGNNCQSKCSCDEGQSCNAIDGECTGVNNQSSKENKADEDKGTKDSRVTTLLSIIVSMSVVAIIACVVIAFVFCRNGQNSLNLNNPVYECAENPPAINTPQNKYVENEIFNTETPSSIELKNVVQNPYQGLTPRQPRDGVSNDVSPVALVTDSTGIDNVAVVAKEM